MTSQTYIYHPISNQRGIRVFILEPAYEYDAPLRGSLRESILHGKPPTEFLMEKALEKGCRDTVELEESVWGQLKDHFPSIAYEALSYVWGAKTGSLPLICDDMILLITQNCNDALRHIRHHNVERNLWVDSICIDQQSTAERNSQVGLMDCIYKSTTQPIIWLGRSDVDMSELTMQTRCFKWLRENLPTRISRNVLGTHALQREMIPKVLESTWYTRIWTFQEQLLPITEAVVRWGEYEAGYIEFQRDLTRHYDSGIQDKRKEVHRLYKEVLQHPHMPKERFFVIKAIMLQTGRLLDTTDPKDRLYGLFGVLKDTNMSLPRPDYSKSVESVFEEFARETILSEGSLWLLLCNLGIKKNLSLPSWVPDWTANDLENNVAFFRALELVLGGYKTTMQSPLALATLSTSLPGEIALKGALLFEIRCTGERVPVISSSGLGYGQYEPVFRPFCSWFCLARALRVINPQTLEVLGLLLQWADKRMDRYQDNDTELMAALFYDMDIDNAIFDEPKRATYQKLAEAGTDESIWQELLQTEAGKSFLRFFWVNFHGSILFSDGEGNLGFTWCSLPSGMAPTGPQTNPERLEVALVAGSDVPVVLRSCGDKFELLGPAYVPGVMNGEKWSTACSIARTIILC